MNHTTFDEQCRLCRFLDGSPRCKKESMKNVSGVDVCIGYKTQDI